MMKIMNVVIPDKMITRTIKSTNWDVEPITNKNHLNPKWIGGRRTQVSIRMIDVLWNSNKVELKQREQHTLAAIESDIYEFDRVLNDNSVVKEELLGDLRWLFIIRCLLEADHYYEYHKGK